MNQETVDKVIVALGQKDMTVNQLADVVGRSKNPVREVLDYLHSKKMVHVCRRDTDHNGTKIYRLGEGEDVLTRPYQTREEKNARTRESMELLRKKRREGESNSPRMFGFWGI